MATTEPRPSLSSRNSSGNLASSTRNPLNLKVHRLLTSNLEDAGTRAALETLGELERSERESGEKQGRGIKAALESGGGLRKEIDARMTRGSKDFLKAFSEVNDVRTLCFRAQDWRKEEADHSVRFDFRNRN
jgi:hypothetical protein